MRACGPARNSLRLTRPPPGMSSCMKEGICARLQKTHFSSPNGPTSTASTNVRLKWLSQAEAGRGEAVKASSQQWRMPACQSTHSVSTLLRRVKSRSHTMDAHAESGEAACLSSGRVEKLFATQACGRGRAHDVRHVTEGVDAHLALAHMPINNDALEGVSALRFVDDLDPCLWVLC